MARPKDPELRKRRRAAVAAATFDLLARESFSALTLDRVAEEAGVSKGLVSYYFGNKDQLIVAAIRQYHDAQAAMLRAIVDGDQPLSERLDSLIAAAFIGREAVEREVRFQSEVWSYAKTNPEAREAIGSSYRVFREACAELLRGGIDRGEVRMRDPADDITSVYLVIHALIDGLTFQVAVDPSLDLDDVRKQLRRSIDRVIELT